MDKIEGMLILVPADGQLSSVAFANGERPSLKDMQKFVGGPIEMVPGLDNIEISKMGVVRAIAYCNEEGGNLSLPENETATTLWAAAVERSGEEIDHTLVGNVLIMTGTSEFLGEA